MPILQCTSFCYAFPTDVYNLVMKIYIGVQDQVMVRCHYQYDAIIMFDQLYTMCFLHCVYMMNSKFHIP